MDGGTAPIKQLLDIGVQNLLVPMRETPGQALAAVGTDVSLLALAGRHLAQSFHGGPSGGGGAAC